MKEITWSFGIKIDSFVVDSFWMHRLLNSMNWFRFFVVLIWFLWKLKFHPKTLHKFSCIEYIFGWKIFHEDRITDIYNGCTKAKSLCIFQRVNVTPWKKHALQSSQLFDPNTNFAHTFFPSLMWNHSAALCLRYNNCFCNVIMTFHFTL